MKLRRFIILGVLLFCLIISGREWPQVLAEDNDSVVINELAWAGSSIGTSDEWIELANPTSAPVDISGWQVTTNTGVETLMLILPVDTTIPAGGYFVIANNDAPTSALAISPDMVTTAVSLSNDKLKISLYRGDFTVIENLVDVAGDGGAPLAGKNNPKVSMERNADMSGWHDAQAGMNFDEGVPDWGTPKAENSVVSDPPSIIAVSPQSGSLEEGGFIINDLTGTNFSLSPVPVLQLKKDVVVITATGVSVVDATHIDHAEFDLTQATAGKWDIILTNPDGRTATLPQAVELFLPSPPMDLNNEVKINEVVPAPTTGAETEFIELVNNSDSTVSLAGWKLDDVANDGSQPFDLNDRTIPARGFLTVYKAESNLTLNDNGDSVRLLQPDGTVLDETTYPIAQRGKSWSHFAAGFAWSTTLTPNGKNILTQPESEKDEIETEEDDEGVEAEVGSIVINELLPNPNDAQEEFIELYNPGKKSIGLSGWSLKDAANKTYRLGEGLSIQAQDGLTLQPDRYAVISQKQSKISLNNSGGETIRLLDATGQTIDMISYPDKAPIGASYARLAKTWDWVTPPSPGMINGSDFEEPEVASEVVIDSGVLPVTGRGIAQQLGTGVTGLAFVAILLWYRRNRYATTHANIHDQKSG